MVGKSVYRQGALALAALLGVSGCVEWFPGKVSKGVARLTVRNAGVILRAIENDTRCGFSSGVEPIIDGELGTLGTATWSVQNCELVFTDQVVESDCLGETKTASGRVVVSATKTVTGWVSGDPADPIVPQTDDAARIEFRAELDDFSVQTSKGPESLRMKSGTLAVSATPRLAQVADVGACAATTPNVLFDTIAYQDAKLHVTSKDKKFDVSVPTSSFSAQSGIGADSRENVLWGDITVWDDHKSFQELKLDPDYNTDSYRESYLCSENYTVPLSHSCGMEETLGNGAARLFVRGFGYTYLAVEHDDGCGFGSILGLLPDDLEAVDDQIKATWIADDCGLAAYDQALSVDVDCQGLEVLMSGSATVDATKAVIGDINLGNPPLLPRTREAVTIDVPRMDMDDLTIWEEGPGATDARMTVERGIAHGTMLPVTGELVSEPGAFAVATPVVNFRGIQIDGADVAVHTGGKTFRFTVDSATIQAFRGSYAGDSNRVSGDILVNGVPVKVSGDLQPDYSQSRFDATYECTEDLLEVVPSN